MSGTERIFQAPAPVFGIRWRRHGRAMLFAADLVCVVAAVHLSVALRLGEAQFTAGTGGAALLCAAVCAALFPAFGLYNRLWRHASVADLVAVVRAVAVATVAFAAVLWLAPRLAAGFATGFAPGFAPGFADVPRSVPLINLFVLVALLATTRLALRAQAVARPRSPAADARVPVLLVGHTESLDLYLRALRADPQAVHRPVGCLVAGEHRGQRLRDVPVLGAPENFRAVYDELARGGRAPRHVILTERPAAGEGGVVEALAHEAERLGVGVFRLASPTELRRPGTEKAIALRPIELTDLLERPQRALDRAGVEAFVRGRRVLVTGAGGSIGSELTRQLAALGPALIVATDASEFNLYAVDLDLRERFPAVPRRAVLCNVRDGARVAEIFAEVRPDIVFHAAALKHVPMVEANPCEGVLTNVVGTRNVVRAAVRCGAAALVQVSTDKVVNPTSVMGATKRMAEHYCQALDVGGGAWAGTTRFMTVRFGNVLGSSGSLIPLFQRQLERGGPLTVTDPRMTRFFMTIREAVELTLQASAAGLASGAGEGKVYVLEMGEPIAIIDIARRVIRLAGLEPERDVAIEIVGVRPGEKLFEELFDTTEERLGAALPGVMAAVPRMIPLVELERGMARLEAWARAGDDEAVVRTLAAILPTYTPLARPAPAAAAPRGRTPALAAAE